MRSPVCADVELVPFFRIAHVPVFCNVLHETRASALSAARGDLDLGYCPRTGLIFNAAFDPELVRYSPEYESSLHFSPRFQQYARSLIEKLDTRHGLRGKLVLEIGCGKGEFLGMLCAAAGCDGIGFDDSVGTATAPEHDMRVRLVRGAFDANVVPEGVDLVLARHVLEHVPAPLSFLGMLREIAQMRTGTAIYVEVPNGLWTLRDLGIWDLIYEHVAYYAPVSLTRALAAAGLVVQSIWTDFGDQFLCAAAHAGPPAAPPAQDPEVAEITHLAAAFEQRFQDKRAHWDAMLERLLGAGKRIDLWGAGSKGVTFLNVLARGGEVTGVVDINPRKHGRYVPGTGQRIVAPSELAASPPDCVLVMNPIYASEIEDQCRELGFVPQILAV